MVRQSALITWCFEWPFLDAVWWLETTRRIQLDAARHQLSNWWHWRDWPWRSLGPRQRQHADRYRRPRANSRSRWRCQSRRTGCRALWRAPLRGMWSCWCSELPIVGTCEIQLVMRSVDLPLLALYRFCDIWSEIWLLNCY